MFSFYTFLLTLLFFIKKTQTNRIVFGKRRCSHLISSVILFYKLLLDVITYLEREKEKFVSCQI